MNSMETLTCATCKEEKPAADFARPRRPRSKPRAAALVRKNCADCAEAVRLRASRSRAGRRESDPESEARRDPVAKFLSRPRRARKRHCPAVRAALAALDAGGRRRYRLFIARQHSRARYRANPEAQTRALREWARNNPDRYKAATSRGSARRRARLGFIVCDLTGEQWAAIVASHGGRCAYCATRPERLTVDHVIPISKGGAHTASNVVPACRACNARKGARPVGVTVQFARASN